MRSTLRHLDCDSGTDAARRTSPLAVYGVLIAVMRRSSPIFCAPSDIDAELYHRDAPIATRRGAALLGAPVSSDDIVVKQASFLNM
jgi:hypothetical protein